MRNSKKATILFSLLFLFTISLVNATMPSPTSIEVKTWDRTLDTQEFDGDGDGLPDVFTTFTDLGNDIIEINAYQTSDDKKYKWQSGIFTPTNKNIEKFEYNPSTDVWSSTGNLGLYDYQWTTGWNAYGRTEGYSLFGSGSGNKTYRINVSELDTFQIFTGENSEVYYYNSTSETWLIYDTDTYEKEGFQITVDDYDTYWIEKDGTTKFFWDDENVTDFINPTITIEDFENKLDFDTENEIIHQKIQYVPHFNPATGITETRVVNKPLYLNIGDLIEHNNLSRDNITITGHQYKDEFESWAFCLAELSWSGYVECLNDYKSFTIEIEGTITDTDPSLDYLFNTTNDYGFDWQINRTEIVDLGLRTDAPILNMQFNSPNESTYVQDNSIYNNFGTNNGATYNSSCGTSPVGHDLGGCYEFDGSEYITVADNSDFNGLEQMTISAWVNLENYENYEGIVSKYLTAGNLRQFYLGDCSGGKFTFVTSSAGITHYAVTTSSTFDTDTWYHITGVFDGGSFQKIYVNGEEQTTVENVCGLANGESLPASIADKSDDIYIGKRSAGAEVEGMIDQVQIWDRALSTNEIKELYTQRTREQQDSLVMPDDSLVSFWKLDGNANDEMGVNNGTASITGYGEENGIVGEGGEFDGVDDVIEVPYSASYAFGDVDYTVSAWVKHNGANTAGKWRGIVSQTDTYPAGYIFRLGESADSGSNKLMFLYGDDDSWEDYTSSTALNEGEWYHVLATYKSDSNDVDIYINGVDDGATRTAGDGGNQVADTDDALRIGEDWDDANNRYFNGEIDEVRIYNRSLSADEILELYQSQQQIGKYARDGDFKSLVFYNATSTYWNVTQSLADNDWTHDVPNSTGLVSYWKLEGNALDSVGSNDGTITGATNTTGFVKKGMRFDGVDDEIYVGTPMDFTGSTSFSTFAWIKTDTPCTDDWIFGTHKDLGWYLRMDDSYGCGYRFKIDDGSAWTQTESTTSLNDNKWHHIGVILDNDDSQIKVYVDGVLDANASSGAVGDMSDGLYISSPHAGMEWNGTIDEVLIYNRSLSASEVSELYQKQAEYYGIGVQDGIGLNSSNLVSYLPLDESYDDLVGGNDGTPTGTNNATGISSGAMRFDGVDDYIRIDETVDYTAYTLSLWVKPEDITYQSLIASTDREGISSYSHYLNIDASNKFQHYTWDGSAEIVTSVTSAVVGEWYHIVGVAENGGAMKLYVNGIEEGTPETIDGTLWASGDRWYVGYAKGSSYTNFSGSIDEVLIYNKSLTASEVEQLYKAGLSQHANTNVTLETRVATSYNVSDAGLVGLWGLNGDANDELGVNNGTASITGYDEENGIVGEGGEFDGTDDYILVGTDGASDSTGTITVWAKYDGINNGDDYVAGSRTGAGQRMYLSYTSNGRHYIGIGGSGAIDTDVDIVTDEWMFLTLIWNSSGYYWYKDTVLEESGATTGIVLGNNICVGCYDNNDAASGGYFNGNIDEVRIYNRSLSADEIQNLYELGSYHIEWGEWDSSGVKTDGEPLTSVSEGNFMQFRDVFNTDDTDVSAYVLNYSVSPGTSPVAEDNPPYWLELPTDISVLDNETILEINNVTDDNGIDSCWTNESFLEANSTNYYNITSLTAGTYSINLTCNDTIGQTNSTFFNIEINATFVDTVNPLWKDNSTNISLGSAGESVYFNVTFTDDYQAGNYIFSWYNGTAWVNDSSQSWTNNTAVQVIKTVPLLITQINWTWYFNDSAGNSNQTDEWSQTIETNPIISNIYPTNGNNYTSIPTVSNATVSFSDGGDKCWYSLDGGTTNSTTIDCGSTGSYEFTSVPFTEGSNTINWYTNSTGGTIGIANSTFIVDLFPTINTLGTYPAHSSVQNVVFPVTVNASDYYGVDTILYSINGEANQTWTSSVNEYLNSGTHEITFCVNDTAGQTTCQTNTFQTTGEADLICDTNEVEFGGRCLNKYNLMESDYNPQPISLTTGWNAFGILPNSTYQTTGTVGIDLYEGDNLIGYSAKGEYNLTDLTFDNGTANYTYAQALSNGLVIHVRSIDYADYNNTEGNRDRGTFYSKDGYWINVSQDLTMWIADITYANKDFVVGVEDLTFVYESVETDLAGAIANNWISGTESTAIKWYNGTAPEQERWKNIEATCPPIGTCRDSVSPWEGYFINSLKDNVQIILHETKDVSTPQECPSGEVARGFYNNGTIKCVTNNVGSGSTSSTAIAKRQAKYCPKGGKYCDCSIYGSC